VDDRNRGQMTERSLGQKIRCSSIEKRGLVLDAVKGNLMEKV